MKRKIYAAIVAGLILAGGTLFWTCAKDENLLSKNNSYTQNLKPKFGKDSLLWVENFQLEARMSECKERFGLDIYEFALAPDLTAIEEELNYFFGCFQERIENMSPEEISAMFGIENFEEDFKLLTEYLQKGEYEKASLMYEKVAPLIHCEWKHGDDYMELNGEKYDIPMQIIMAHSSRIKEHMEGLYKEFPVLLGMEEKDVQMALETAFFTSIVHYGKGIKLPNTKLPSGAGALKDCQNSAGYAITAELAIASTSYTIGLASCGSFVVPWAIAACALGYSGAYAYAVYSAHQSYKTAMELCQYKYGN